MKKLFFILVLGVLAFAGCRSYPTIHNIEHQAVTGNDEKQVEQKIIAGGMRAKGWHISKVKNGLLIGTFRIRTHKAIVEIPYSADEYSIIYKDSQNLKYNAKKKTIHSRYNRSVSNLSRAINKSFL